MYFIYLSLKMEVNTIFQTTGKAGILSVTSITATIGAFQIMVEDNTKKI